MFWRVERVVASNDEASETQTYVKIKYFLTFEYPTKNMKDSEPWWAKRHLLKTEKARVKDDDLRPERPIEVTIPENVAAVQEAIEEDRRITHRQSEELNIFVSTFHLIVNESLQLRKFCTLWVPQSLSEEHQQCRRKVWVFEGEEQPTQARKSVSVGKRMVLKKQRLLQRSGTQKTSYPR
ncbi:hypothetical protein ANN_23430 [Periplaneta americana]|uniref:Uncharacterized protein n=1 Tax=Periplaneta americana TaxID=6978 RepID=A0ABQ8SL30_PERAM|nr:hypothetical protein ANN_23430 [Periplaneta americana]